jgi:hypothetical protein
LLRYTSRDELPLSAKSRHSAASKPTAEDRDMNSSDEALHQFFGGYFHQDWQLDDPTWQVVISRFLRESTPTDSALVAAGIERLISDSSPDETLCCVVQKLGCDYWPGSFSEMRIWLKQVVSELR